MDGNKTTYESIDHYISTFPLDIQEILESIRQVIREAAPEAAEKISYQMPTFAQQGNVVHFAAFKHHIGFYPAPSGIEEFEQELAPYKAGKGTIQFPIGQPMPMELIAKIVKFRVAENLAKAEQKAAKKKK
ncbi:iron chaperone [Paenibacillus sp. GCM10027629]|uniref:iron chaperone n=1 Tax=Paenibacillus sp. GCM10027629 TaxID=3273414 RepID=UPI00362ECB6B